MKKFNELLLEYRKCKDITQSELGESLGKGQSTIVAWEKGVNFPTSKDVIKIAEMLNITKEELITSIKTSKELKLGTVFVRFDSSKSVDELKQMYKFEYDGEQLSDENILQIMELLAFQKFKSQYLKS